MRGTRGEGGSRGSPARLIPARAGNIEGGDAATEQPPAHPRSHGEHSSPKPHAIDTLGSSPLSQGTFVHVLHLIVPLRLIPAHAGNIQAAHPGTSPWSAHPRSRGEHLAVLGFPPCGYGSSPLARGTCIEQLNRVISSRLIPARAGNMCRSSSRSSGCSAHPRSRGEHTYEGTDSVGRPGSSPLARGTYLVDGLQNVGRRLIPARAGNICWRSHDGISRTAHPRSRGEHTSSPAALASSSGSSPLARGTSPGGQL